MDLSGFNPADPADPSAGIFGLPHGRTEARIVLLPVPFEATTSYRPGTAEGPRAIFDASMQVDLFDRRLGRVYERGIYMEVESERVGRWNEEASALARPMIRAGGGDRSDPRQEQALTRIDAIDRKSTRLNSSHGYISYAVFCLKKKNSVTWLETLTAG